MNQENLLQKIEALESRIHELENSGKRNNLFRFVKKSFTRMNVVIGIGVTILITSLAAYAAQISFIDGDIISAGEVNSNFTELYEAAAVNADDITDLQSTLAANSDDISQLNGNVITESVTRTIGTGGDFADFIEANEWLKTKMIAQGAYVTLQLTGNLTLNDPASYTWRDGTLAGIHIQHRDGDKIIIDLGGYDLTVGNGIDTLVFGINVENGNKLFKLKNGQILSANNGQGIGVRIAYNSSICLDVDVIIGDINHGFYVGILSWGDTYVLARNVISQHSIYGFEAYCGGYIDATEAEAHYCNTGYFASAGGYILAEDSIYSNCTTGYNPNLDTIGNSNSYITYL